MIARRVFNLPTMSWRNPFAEMDRMSRQLNQLTGMLFGRPEFDYTPASVFPAVNITEDADKFYVRAELPGIAAGEIDVQVNGRNLTISGERKASLENSDARYHRRERETGKFSRVIGLPGDIDAQKVEAAMAKGVLTVTLAKPEASKPRQIAVN